MDFVSFPGARDAERNGRKRENQAQNRLSGAVGEVRKFPNEPTKTGRFWPQPGEKKPTERGWFFNKWWRRRESNPRPEVLYRQFYILSAAI